MMYNFLNDIMQQYLSLKAKSSGFMFSVAPEDAVRSIDLPIELSEKEKEVLQHDFDSFSKLISFLNNNKKTFVLEGFMGSGKSSMLNILPRMLDSSVLYFRVNCFESTNLDDILLALHTSFINYYNEKRILLPKVESAVFADKINAYIKSGNMPMVFVFDSIDTENLSLHEDIVNFIKHLAFISKIKVIVTYRNANQQDFTEDGNTSFALIKLYGQEEMIALLKKHGIESDEKTYQDIFAATKGHYLYISLLINVVSLLNVSLASIYNDYSKKKMIIFDFLISKVLTLIPERFLKTLWFLALIRTGVSEKFLIEQQLSTKDELVYLEERMLLCREGSAIYLKDYVKNTVVPAINLQTQKSIHDYLYELYEAQLPKKPSERDLIISRRTMRSESAYHKEAADNTVVKNQPQQNVKQNVDYNYLSYSKSVNNKDWSIRDSGIKRTIKPAPRGLETRIKNNLTAKNREISEEELNMVNQLNMRASQGNFANTVSDIQDEDIQHPQITNYQNNRALKYNTIARRGRGLSTGIIPPREDSVETLTEVMQAAKQAEDKFDFKKALAIYTKAFSMTNDEGYAKIKPVIIMQTAFCHKKMHNKDEAVKYFEMAYKLYSPINQEKANQALYNMGELYSESYNIDKAKSVYEMILSSNPTDDIAFRIRVLLNLGEIESNNSNIEKAYEYYNEAYNLSVQTDNKKLICEACFKFGLAYDDAGDVEKAFKMYAQCIQTSKDYEVNSFISSAYSNIAGIFEEQNLMDKACKYYEEAVKTDEKYNNWDGLYFSYSKLGAIYQSKSVTFATDFLLKAVEAAKQLQDKMYEASAYIQIGDLYYKSNSDEEALNSYLLAKNILINQPDEENIRKIDIRINDMKSRLGEAAFNYILREFQEG